MKKERRLELKSIEKQIFETAKMKDFWDEQDSWTDETKHKLKYLLKKRCELLNEMFEGSQEEVERFWKVNDLLCNLTKKMHSKALNLYRNLLKSGYDPDFDDDITLEATLKYDLDADCDFLYDENKPDEYGSRYWIIMAILNILYEESYTSECAFCNTSYVLRHNLDMTPEELGLDDFLDDGKSWSEAPLDRPEFKDICICHAIHDLCCHKSYSIPDLLKMNNFRIDINIAHQHSVNIDGERNSYIIRQ